MASDADISGLKDIPGYKAILKAVLKTQIQGLVEQLALHTDEESVLITANISDGTLSHLGSKSGKTFLSLNEDVKSQFLGFCVKMHHQQAAFDTNVEQTLDLLKSSNKTQPQRQGVRQRPVPYTVPKRTAVANTSAVKSTATCSSQESVPISHTETGSSLETFVIKQEPSSDDDDAVGAIVYKSESMEMDSTKSASVNVTSDNLSGANWTEPAHNLFDNNTESGQTLNVTQNSSKDVLTDADQQEIDELLANRSDVPKASVKDTGRADDNGNGPVQDSNTEDTFQKPATTKDGQVDTNEESQNIHDKAELKELKVHCEGIETGQDSVSDSPLVDDKTEIESLKNNSEIPKSGKSLNESTDTAGSDLGEDNDIDTGDEIDVENVGRIDTKKDVCTANIKEITSDGNDDSKHHHKDQVSESEINKTNSYDIVGQKVSDGDESCGLNPGDSNDSSIKETDTEKSGKSDDDSQDKHFKVLAIWNEIANDSNDTSSEVLYDLITEKLKHDTDEKTSVEESSQTDNDLIDKNESTKLQPKSLETESVQKNNSGFTSTADSQKDETDGTKSTSPASQCEDASSTNSNGSQSTDNVNATEKEIKEVKNISDHQQTVTCAKNTAAKKTDEQSIENNPGGVKRKDDCATVPTDLSDKQKQDEKLLNNKQSDEVSKPKDAEVIDLEKTGPVSHRPPKPNSEMKTPVKQIIRKKSAERQSPSVSSKTGVGNQSTPGKQNFIDNLISKGVPIIIPDEDDDVMPSPRTTAFKSKSKHYIDQKSGTRTPKANFPMYSVGASAMQQFSPQQSDKISSFSQQQNMYSMSQQLSDINQNQASQFPVSGINQQYSSRNQTQNYHKQSSPQQYSSQSPSQQYLAPSPSQAYMTQSPTQSYHSMQQDNVNQKFSPRHSLLRQRLFSPPKNVKLVAPVERNRAFPGLSNEVMFPRQTSPIRQSFSPPITPTKPRSNIPNMPSFIETMNQTMNQVHPVTSASAQKTYSQAKVRTPNKDQNPRISPGTTIVIDDEPALIKNTPSNKQYQVQKANITQVLSPQQVLMQSQQITKSSPVQAENTTLPIITNVTSLPMLADQGNQQTSEALSQALAQQVVFVPVEVIPQTPSANIQNANEKTPIKRGRSIDSVDSPSETYEPSSKRSHTSNIKTEASQTSSRPNTPAKMLLTQPDVDESVHKITPKVEIDVDEVREQLSPDIRSPSSTSTDPDPSSQDYDNSMTSSLHLKSDLKSFSPPISPSTQRMRPDHKKKKTRKASGSKKSSFTSQEETTEALPSKSKQKDFGCGDCGKSYKTKAALNQHFKKHTQDRPFECDVCGKHFSQKAYLKKHIYTHFKENE